jgi:aspartate aminotransferase
MSSHLDLVPFSGIIRIRDMMYGVRDPFRLDQGDVSFDAPETFKAGMHRAIAENQSHYLPTTGVPRLLELLVEKLRHVNGTPVEDPGEVMVTNGGIHALYLACQALLEPGDEVLVPDPTWPPAVAIIATARAIPVPCPLVESLGWRFDLERLAASITPRTRAIYVNSPHNPTGGVLTRADVEAIAAIAERHDLWIVSDEAYEDVRYGDTPHVSPASLPGLYERTIAVYTFSKSYAATGVRVGYLATRDDRLRDRLRKLLFYTTSNVSSIAQFGAIAALEGGRDCITAFREELTARRDLFYDGVAAASGGLLTGAPPPGAFYAFLRIGEAWTAPPGASRSWSLAEQLIAKARIGCVPGADFGAGGEGYLRFCFARDRRELTGALDSMRTVLGGC